MPKSFEGMPAEPAATPTPEEKEYFEVNGKEFKIASLELGGKTAEQYKAMLTKEGFHIMVSANDLLAKMPVSKERQEASFVRLTVAELGFKEAANYDDICRRAKELGLDLAPAEVGPALRLSMKEQAMNDWVVVGMEAIMTTTGSPSLFSVERDRDGSWLHANYGSPDNVWLPDRSFVFVPRKQSSSTETKE